MLTYSKVIDCDASSCGLSSAFDISDVPMEQNNAYDISNLNICDVSTKKNTNDVSNLNSDDTATKINTNNISVINNEDTSTKITTNDVSNLNKDDTSTKINTTDVTKVNDVSKMLNDKSQTTSNVASEGEKLYAFFNKCYEELTRFVILTLFIFKFFFFFNPYKKVFIYERKRIRK